MSSTSLKQAPTPMRTRPRTSIPRCATATAVALFIACVARIANAQSEPPVRSDGWRTASHVFVGLGAGSQLLMPRVHYAELETTIGWKARWHVSVLAPVMTLTVAALTSEYAIKPAVKGYRPGCDHANRWSPGCATFGAPSTHVFASFSSLGHGTGVFLVDTLKWNDGRFHGGAFAGDVVVPLVAAGFTVIGRMVGRDGHESGGQVLAGAGFGLGLGLLSGVAYSLMQRPECGYGSGVVCW